MIKGLDPETFDALMDRLHMKPSEIAGLGAAGLLDTLVERCLIELSAALLTTEILRNEIAVLKYKIEKLRDEKSEYVSKAQTFDAALRREIDAHHYTRLAMVRYFEQHLIALDDYPQLLDAMIGRNGKAASRIESVRVLAEITGLKMADVISLLDKYIVYLRAKGTEVFIRTAQEVLDAVVSGSA